MQNEEKGTNVSGRMQFGKGETRSKKELTVPKRCVGTRFASRGIVFLQLFVFEAT